MPFAVIDAIELVMIIGGLIVGVVVVAVAAILHPIRAVALVARFLAGLGLLADGILIAVTLWDWHRGQMVLDRDFWIAVAVMPVLVAVALLAQWMLDRPSFSERRQSRKENRRFRSDDATGPQDGLPGYDVWIRIPSDSAQPIDSSRTLPDIPDTMQPGQRP